MTKPLTPINTNNLVIPIEEVHPNKWNPKLPHNDTPEGKKNYARLKKSMARHGQIEPVLVRQVGKEFEIINGHHRFYAAQELGWIEIEVKNLGKIADTKAKAIALATEDVRVPLEMVEVAKIVKEILALDDDAINDLPYSEEDAHALEEMVDFDWSDPDEKKEKEGEGDGEDEEGYDITIPPSLVPKWKALCKAKKCSDTEMITVLINGA